MPIAINSDVRARWPNDVIMMEIKSFRKNQVETAFVQKNTSILGITSSLASYYLLYDNTSLINDEIEIYRSITREDIKEVANKYLNPNQRLDMDYVKKQ